MLQLVSAVLYAPPTQIATESVFSVQKWLLSGRRATMTPANRNLRMVGRSCMRLKRWIDEVKIEMQHPGKAKIDWILIEKVESKFVCERSEQTYSLRSKVKAFEIFYLRDCAQIYLEKLV